MSRSAPAGFHLVEADRTYARPDVEDAAALWASDLRRVGAVAAEPIVIVGPNDARSVVALLAIRRAGAVAVPLHPSLSPPEIQGLARRHGARLALVATDVKEAAASTVALPRPGEPLPLGTLKGPLRRVPADFLLFTSGTEGQAKGVLLGEAGLRRHADAVLERLPGAPSPRWLASLGLAHVGGLAMLVRAEHAGHGLVLAPSVTSSELSAAVAKHGVTHVSVVPTVLQRWLDAHGDRAPPPSLRCVLVGGAHAPTSLLERARRSGWPVRATYGLTEAGSQVATAREDTPIGSVGPSLQGVQVRIESGRNAPSGRILVRSPAQCVGYLDAPSPVDADGWLRTQDVGRLDADGNLWVLGRASDLIITGGENVDPSEVEAALLTHPGVDEAAVVGVPDPEWGEAVVAFVVPRRGHEPGLEELREHCAAGLARFKLPKRLVRVERLPRTATGKVRRSELRERTPPP